MINLLLSLLTLTGAVVWIGVLAALLYYRPTPNGTLRGAITRISWTHAFGLFILPPTLVGLMDGVPLLGFLFGAGFVAVVVVVVWWFPI